MNPVAGYMAFGRLRDEDNYRVQFETDYIHFVTSTAGGQDWTYYKLPLDKSEIRAAVIVPVLYDTDKIALIIRNDYDKSRWKIATAQLVVNSPTSFYLGPAEE